MLTAAAQPRPCPENIRYKIRFPDSDSFVAASSLEMTELDLGVSNPKRLYFTLALPAFKSDLPAERRTFEKRAEALVAEFGASLEEDYRWSLDGPPPSFPDPSPASGPSLDDVLRQIRAPEAWAAFNRGEGATIAVVDSGVEGRRAEFPEWKRRGSWQVGTSRPFTDPFGHGTMCAVIAAGSRAAGGRFSGVAPDAGLIACRTRFFDSELAAIYDHLAALARAKPDLRLVVTNSFGRRFGHPGPPEVCDFPAALTEALTLDLAVLFSAGNNHELAGGRPEHCHPPTIWHHKLRDEVFTVGACDLDGHIWSYSSRGPGSRPGGPKPDLVAPVPSRGLVAFGEEDRRFPDGWGTSGACPQAAGLAALLWTADPGLRPPELFELMRAAAVDLGRAPACQGGGRLDCLASLETLARCRIPL